MTRHSKPTAGVTRTPKAGLGNRVRIIGGNWRSRVLDFPDVEGLRPTANRVRETLFNWLGQTLREKRCLDLFAGSGALGFEAASRGAAEVVMIENSRVAINALKRNRELLSANQCRVVAQDATRFLAGNREKFDVVFVDPPFGSGMMAELLGMVAAHLAPGGVVYAEWNAPIGEIISLDAASRWHLAKHGKAGAVHFGLLSIGKGAT